jgi:hypothetical protein
MRAHWLWSAACSALLCSWAGPAWGDGVLPSAATPVQREQAQSRFSRGKDLMGKKRYEEALAEFKASREIVASPNARLEIARCLLALGDPIAAYAELGRTAVEAKELTAQDNRYQRAYDAALAERAEIEPSLGFVTLSIAHPADDTRVLVAGEEIRRAAWNEPAPLRPGATEVVVETPGRVSLRRSLTVAAGEKVALDVDVESAPLDRPAPPTPPPSPPTIVVKREDWTRPAAYVSGGVGVVGLVTFAVAGIMARSAYDDLNGACGSGGLCPASKSGEISAGKSEQTVANVGLVLGIAGAVAGATLFAVSLSHGARTSSGAALVVSPTFVGVRGSL